MRLGAWLTAAALVSAPAAAAQVEFTVTGALVREPLSDPLFGSHGEPLTFRLRLVVDGSKAEAVPAGRLVSLPNASTVSFATAGLLIPADAVKGFQFEVPGTNAHFDRSQLITDPTAIYVAGSLDHPSGVNLLLASERNGTLEIGTVECTAACQLGNGVVLDRAGPFGVVRTDTIRSRRLDPAQP
jgi:hypothetical protein